MKGRYLFRVAYPVLFLFSRFLYLLPRQLVRFFWCSIDLIPGFLGVGLRYAFALRLSKKIGHNVFLGRGIEVLCWERLSIGDNVSIHKDCYIDATGSLIIGDNVSIAHSSSILTFEHSWSDSSKPIKYNQSIYSPVSIGDDVWIGCGCRILSGICIGSRVVVAAGAVVTKNIPAGVLIGGVPAKVIKSIVK
ncbi:Hexapeptide repeat of succinyl-transferase [Pseudomonas cuatrocienegasensis]|uniref:Hexapeptide repeat of succinyl-transferase n=1 Tax=Pseudomonas cuatrocienegasensis TaxID=543360 RepID=A0ABY1B9R4_9PSED|nr:MULTISPECIES: acyltransferase [Pseudomonas]OEC35429.1 hypothetical protein A7D25_09355 [Pseudomonas sp. 21C1]SEQ31990.1 Hexapeptide repeat of succinyl-transferase [Pseudomonas cuatrocienegasensis]